VALDLGHAGEPEGAVVLAEEQTAGRGRAGRKWHSERAAAFTQHFFFGQSWRRCKPTTYDDGGLPRIQRCRR